MCWEKIAFFLVNRDRGLEIHTFCQIDSVYQCVCVYLTRTHTRAFKLQQHWQLIHCEERIIMPWLRLTATPLSGPIYGKPACQILLVLLQNILIYGDIWA